jgi:hypothetical protein
VWRGCENWLRSSNYGRTVIKLADGTNVYAVRQAWGHRRQLYLTLDSDGCRPANPATDYILKNEAATVVVYRVTSTGLTIFSDLKPFEIQQPSRPWTHGRPTVVVAKDPEIGDLVRHAQQYSVSVADIPDDEVCLINLFRTENSFYQQHPQ